METKLSELVARLKSAVGDNLKAVVLYGSAATGEFQGQHSDLNVLCVLDRAGNDGPRKPSRGHGVVDGSEESRDGDFHDARNWCDRLTCLPSS